MSQYSRQEDGTLLAKVSNTLGFLDYRLLTQQVNAVVVSLLTLLLVYYRILKKYAVCDN